MNIFWLMWLFAKFGHLFRFLEKLLLPLPRARQPNACTKQKFSKISPFHLTLHASPLQHSFSLSNHSCVVSDPVRGENSSSTGKDGTDVENLVPGRPLTAFLNSSRAPNIIVKFVRRETRDCFYKGRKLLRDKSTRDLDLARYSENKIYISENLTQANKDIFKESLQVKKDLKYKFIWTFYGRTYLRKDSESPVVAILKLSDLDILKQDGGVHSSSADPNG